jgi:hypothetical protein
MCQFPRLYPNTFEFNNKKVRLIFFYFFFQQLFIRNNLINKFSKPQIKVHCRICKQTALQLKTTHTKKAYINQPTHLWTIIILFGAVCYLHHQLKQNWKKKQKYNRKCNYKHKLIRDMNNVYLIKIIGLFIYIWNRDSISNKKWLFIESDFPLKLSFVLLLIELIFKNNASTHINT